MSRQRVVSPKKKKKKKWEGPVGIDTCSPLRKNPTPAVTRLSAKKQSEFKERRWTMSVSPLSSLVGWRRFGGRDGDGGKTVHRCKFREGRRKKSPTSQKVKKNVNTASGRNSTASVRISLLRCFREKKKKRRWRSSVEVKTEIHDEERKMGGGGCVGVRRGGRRRG